MKKLVLMSAIALITTAPTMAAKSKKKTYKKKKTSVTRLKKTKKEKTNDHVSGVRITVGLGSRTIKTFTDETGNKYKAENPESFQVVTTSIAKGYSMGGFISGSTGFLTEYATLSSNENQSNDSILNGGVEQKFFMNFGSSVMFRPYIAGSATYASVKSDADFKASGYELKYGAGVEITLGSTFFINLNASLNTLHLKTFEAYDETYDADVSFGGNQYGVNLGLSF